MPSKDRPLIFETTTRPPGFKLSELTDLQIKIISYLLRVKYAERLLDDSEPTRGQLVVSDDDPGGGSDWIEIETWNGEPIADQRRTHFLWDPVDDNNDENNDFIESGANPNTDIERVAAKSPSNIGMTTIQDEGDAEAQAGVSWPNTGFGPEGPNRTRSIGDNANTAFNPSRVRALKQYADGVVNDLPIVEMEDALPINAGEVGDSDPLVLEDSPHEFHYWQCDDLPETPTAEDCDEFGYVYYDEAGYGFGPGLMAIGRQEEKIVAAIIEDCLEEMKTGDGIGTYYVEANSDGEPTDGVYEKIGTFYWDTRSNYTDPESPISTIDDTIEIDVIEYYEMYLKTGSGSDFNLNNAFNNFDNIVFLDIDNTEEPGALKTIETTGGFGSEEAVRTKYEPINDLIEKILLPYLELNDNLPVYKFYRSRPDRKKTRGKMKDTRYRKNISFLSPDYATTYTYQLVDIPDSSSSFYTTTFYLAIEN